MKICIIKIIIQTERRDQDNYTDLTYGYHLSPIIQKTCVKNDAKITARQRSIKKAGRELKFESRLIDADDKESVNTTSD